ncbi:hypothetical protein PG984_014588 [Apiospora sp. TS-2023a]
MTGTITTAGTAAKDHSRVQAAAERALADQTNLQLSRARLVTVFAALSLTLLITFVDQNGIGVTLPTIAVDLEAGDTISWAGTSSLIANTAFVMLYGRLSDIFGRKVVFLAAVGLLSVAALLCGFAQNAASFYVFRALAGIGGGGVSNLAMIIVSDIVTLERRGKYQGIIGSCVGLGNILGPFLAAAFISSSPRTTWRAFFWTTSPLAALMGGIAWFLVPGAPPQQPQESEQGQGQGRGKKTWGEFWEGVRKIDWAGVLTSSTAVVFLLIPISGGGRNPVISIMLAQSFLMGAVYQSYLYYLPLYLQNARRYSVLESAAFTASLVAAQMVFSVAGGQYIARTKRYGEVIWFGFGSWTLGSCLTLLYTATTPAGLIVLPLLFIGAGVGCIFQPILVAFQAHVTKAKRAVIIANRNFFRCGGGACGLAVSGAVLQAALRANLPAEYAYLAESTYAAPAATGEADGVVDGVLEAYVAASRAVFILQIPLIGLCLLGCAFIRDRGLQPLKEDGDEGDGEIKEEFDSSVDELRQQQHHRSDGKAGPRNPVDENLGGNGTLVQVENRQRSEHQI